MPAPLDDPTFLKRGEPGYDAAREQAIWNKRLHRARSPDAIVRCTGAEEVAAAIRSAAAHGLRVSPRGSGHHYEAAALREGGLMLDLGRLDSIEIDAAARTARVGAGVCDGVLAERLAAEGLAFPVGHCVDVGLSGYILAGGFGWNAGEWGAACANVTAIELVTAAGEIVRASAEHHADLFWAARGHGPGFFAAVTAYHLQLHPLPPVTYAWRGYFTATCAPALADWLTAAAAATHPAVEIGCFLLTHWDTHEPAVILRVAACAASEDEARDRLVAFASPPAAAEAISAPCGEVVAFPELFRMSPMPAGKRVAADHLWSEAPLGELLLAVGHLPAPSRHATIDIVAFGGGGRVELGGGALSVGGGTGAGIYALWDDPADDEANRAWVRRVDDALAPLRAGRYVGEADLTQGPERLAECFTAEALARLGELRQRHDPGGLFFTWP
ncbi:MAG TPA: FAD-binding oxidoreductase [Croceibacterium sp.]|nr:FAD-binding oxidoreductase [Croceibacterium sp.]